MKNKVKEYVVFLKQTDEDDKLSGESGFYNGIDYQGLYKFLVTGESLTEYFAIITVINYYYEKFWTNTSNNKDLFNQELDKFKKSLDKLESESYLDYLPNKQKLIDDYQKELRSRLNCTDKTLDEFKTLSLYNKMAYLENLGCFLDYFVIPKKFINKFETINLKF